ncbi:MalY/PatB family protein [Enterococcus faecalis]|uniref:MalY/PatB family protein n=1 Tax=Enterococcus TaxID=1350 RepID=UPI00046C6F73|nr:MalY/PatB family protein [Enterococcus faecalis]EGO2675347.1 pyridoxal phosphate-dependent aminotransferase [Enterococcus faecalis]EGO2720249.1 pyridoxal phosphate-dependent aminotransferase [Enterococcus faecalis]EGO2847534.1 pyridoxal phosphate-dependent aminotransferase [Enterococcus faecalis]EGO5117696.1 pyridoxal phosphate-dependent aminotransferase [Enterococcus faecalis]EGO5239372.1 pyridoxal phosphate-dependent aminotransferase [Enterococcus faecalis]
MKSVSFDKAIDRRGTYCTQWDFVEDRFGEADLLPFTISDTDFAVPEAVLATLQERLNHPVFGYTRWNHPQLKEAIQTWYQARFQTKIEEHWIMYTPTVIYGISALIQLLTNEGEGIILQTPAYDAFFKVIQENKRQVVANELLYQEKRYSIDFIDLEKKLAQPENRCLLLCSPHNPTGRVWEQWELERMVSLCQQYDVFLLSDEIHMDIVNKGQVHRPITQFDYKKSAIITSGTKTFNFPGLIFAYALIPDNELRDAFQLKLKNADGLSSTSILGMLATMTAYQKCGTWVDELNDYLAENQRYVKDFLQTYLPKIKVTELEATYLMWLDVSTAVPDVARLQEALVSVGKVAIMDGSIYGGNGQRFLRLNIGCSQAKLHEGLERMRQGFEVVLQKDGTASALGNN